MSACMPARTSCSTGATKPFGPNVMPGTLVVTFAIWELVAWRQYNERCGRGHAACVGHLDLAGNHAVFEGGDEHLSGYGARHCFRSLRELRLDQRDIVRLGRTPWISSPAGLTFRDRKAETAIPSQ